MLPFTVQIEDQHQQLVDEHGIVIHSRFTLFLFWHKLYTSHQMYKKTTTIKQHIRALKCTITYHH